MKVYNELVKAFPDYSFVDFLNDVKTLKHLTKKKMDMMYQVEDDLKQRRVFQIKKM